MGVDKAGSKTGGYVGGFFQLFDWKAKSRKKLFSSKSDFPGTTVFPMQIRMQHVCWPAWQAYVVANYILVIILSFFMFANVFFPLQFFRAIKTGKEK